ncbi:unnamed protein product [Prorocentrum cordatum]|uniref:WW domain-containing protein n=1 Tax=Prorocentrum cordatum TaxID=2364126 RepID=A0ABN9T0G0_9DINO|nr:unnamed protein product [Polarella glacialis]
MARAAVACARWRARAPVLTAAAAAWALLRATAPASPACARPLPLWRAGEGPQGPARAAPGLRGARARSDVEPSRHGRGAGGRRAAGVGGGGGGAPSLFGGLGGEKAPTDKFLTDRLPVLAKCKPVVFGIVFLLAYYKGWVGPWGMFFGMQSKSYFDLLGIPMRCVPQSPCFGSPFVYTQLYADLLVRAPGFILKLPTYIKKLIDGSLAKELEEKMDSFAQSARDQATQPQQKMSVMQRLQELAQQQQGRQAGPPPRAAPRSSPGSGPSPGRGEWQAALDPATGQTYYWNTATRQTCWEQPGAGKPPARPAAADVIDV